MKTVHIDVFDRAGEFAENKDIAKKIRVDLILPAIERGDRIVLDFEGVKGSTQSFMHALFSYPLQTKGETLLDVLEFKNCDPLVKELVLTVIDYTLNPSDAYAP